MLGEPESAALVTTRLTEPQRRHLIELYGDGETHLYWKATHGSPEYKCALALCHKGLVRGAGTGAAFQLPAFELTDAGRRVAEVLRDV